MTNKVFELWFNKPPICPLFISSGWRISSFERIIHWSSRQTKWQACNQCRDQVISAWLDVAVLLLIHVCNTRQEVSEWDSFDSQSDLKRRVPQREPQSDHWSHRPWSLQQLDINDIQWYFNLNYINICCSLFCTVNFWNVLGCRSGIPKFSYAMIQFIDKGIILKAVSLRHYVVFVFCGHFIGEA